MSGLVAVFCAFLLLINTLSIDASGSNASRAFQLVGLFTTIDPDPFISEAYGIYPREAARLAVEHVREEGLLDEYNYQLKLFEVETVCDQTGAVIATLEFKENSGKKVSLWCCCQFLKSLHAVTSYHASAINSTYSNALIYYAVINRFGQ